MDLPFAALALCLALLMAPILWLPGWLAEQRTLPSIANAGRPWQRREHVRVGRRERLRLFTDLRGPARFRLRRRGLLDRWMVGLRIAPEAGVGDPSFDRDWLLECRGDAAVAIFDPATLKLLLAFDEALSREACRLRLLEMRDAELSLTIDCAKADPQLPVSRLLGLARPLVDALEPSVFGHQYIDDLRAGSGAAWPLWLLLPLALVCIPLLWRVWTGPDLLHEFAALQASLVFGGPLAAVFLVASVLAFRRRRSAAEVLRRAILLGVPVILLASHLLYREANIRLDRGRVESIVVTRAPVFLRESGKGVAAWFHLPGADGGRGAEIRIRPERSAFLALGWPPRGELSGRVEVMPGAFGHPWVSWISGEGGAPPR